MKNRIDRKFKGLKAKRKKAFIAFLTAGDPNLALTEKLVPALAQSGADLIELGVPFSDPLADGPTIQAASQRALEKGVTLSKILASVKRIRRTTQIPLALMTYYNPVFHYGIKRFCKAAAAAGVDGVIIPDLPPEEGQDLARRARQNGLAVVFFLAPTTTLARMRRVVKASNGFIYYVSTTGVTGARRELPRELLEGVRKAKRLTRKPVCVGFGISTPDQVNVVSRFADGVIIGSAIVKEINRNRGKKDLVRKVSQFVCRLSSPLR